VSDDQRAMMAARYAKQNAKPKGGDRRSVAAKPLNQSTPTGRGLFTPPRSRKDEQPAKHDAAQRMNVAPARVQKATAVLKASPELAAQFAKAHPKKEGRPPKTAPHGGAVSPKNPARVGAAQQMNVAPKRVEKAATVLKASPELAAQVHSGELKLALLGGGRSSLRGSRSWRPCANAIPATTAARDPRAHPHCTRKQKQAREARGACSKKWLN